MKMIWFMMLLVASQAGAVSFNKSKKTMYKKLFNNSGKTLYCGCEWTQKKVDLTSCGLAGYFPKKQRKRANRTEAEHIIPASWMLKVNKKKRQCAIEAKELKQNARKFCQKYDTDYRRAHNDLVNLYPAVGQVNADRSNKPYLDQVKKLKSGYGKCQAVNGTRGFVPPESRKGDIARVAFYMNRKYGVTYSKRQQKIFETWNLLDPESKTEKEHHAKIVKIQGYGIE